MFNRWERLLESKPIPLFEHLLEEAARLIAQDFCQWPLPIAPIEIDEPLVTGVGSDESKPPHPKVYEESLRITQWELERQFDAINDYMRNHRWEAIGLTAHEKGALLLLSRWLLESLFSLGEATQGKVQRRHMLDLLQRLRRHVSTMQQEPPT